MKTVDFGAYIVIYNLIIGLLIMIASEKLGVYAGYLFGPYKQKAARLTHIGALAFGCCVTVLSCGIYLFWHVLKV